MKAIINYFKQRRERKLKLKCLNLTIDNGGDRLRAAKLYYDWLKEITY